MVIVAQVVGDKIVSRPASREYAASETRELLVMDRDEKHPLRGLLTVKVDLKDPVSPWKDGAPSLVGSVVELGVTDLSTYDGAKVIIGKGSLVRIAGVVEFKPVPQQKAA